MKFVTYFAGAQERFGILLGGEIVDPLLAGGDHGLFADMRTFIGSGEHGLERARHLASQAPADARLPLPAVRLAPPLRPSTMLCAGSNYRAHNREKLGTPTSGREPEFFIKTADCVVGPEEPILLDAALTRKLDCETELAVIIGRPGRHIPIESALDHVFGYTVVNDVTARDRQVRRSEVGLTWYDLGRGKAFDSSAPLGPCIVSADEVGDPQRLALCTRINGELRQSSNTADMIWSCAELIHFFSISFTLRPGMAIITGTPAGTAWSTDRELGGKWQGEPGLVPASRYCLPGDVVECELEKIGVLRNTIAESRPLSSSEAAA